VSYRIRFTEAAEDDIYRLYEFQVARDLVAAKHAIATIKNAFSLLAQFPFSCRKADPTNPRLREPLISFGNSGYVALFEIESDEIVTVLALRHQREDDYH
jgi:plasmid stabilization system protein ParE